MSESSGEGTSLLSLYLCGDILRLDLPSVEVTKFKKAVDPGVECSCLVETQSAGKGTLSEEERSPATDDLLLAELFYHASPLAESTC